MFLRTYIEPWGRLGRSLWLPIGQERASWIFRSFCLVIVIFFFRMMVLDSNHPMFYLKQLFHPDLLGVLLYWVMSLLGTLFGPRLILVVLLAIAAPWSIWDNVAAKSGKFEFIADEIIIYGAIPLMVGVTALVGQHLVARASPGTSLQERLSHGWVDDGITSTFRIMIVCALFFAGFHKYNDDFMNIDTSCLELNEDLHKFWGVPMEWLAYQTPWHIVGGEMGSALLLILTPRLGIIFAAMLVNGLAHIGPIAFGAMCIVLTFGFWRKCDITILRAWWRRSWPFGLLVLALVWGLSLWLYNDSRNWAGYAIFEAILVFGLLSTLRLLVEDLRVCRQRIRNGVFWGWAIIDALGPRAGTINASVTPEERRPSWILFPRPPLMATLAACWLVLHMFNGFTPYLGVKFRLSYAMLSNLRVDDLRWNHRIVPSWVRIVKPSPHLILKKVHVPRKDRNKVWAMRSRKHIRPRMTLPWKLHPKLKRYARKRIRVDLTFVHKGEKRTVNNAAFDEIFLQWLEDQPSGRLQQYGMSIRNAQRCIH